MTNVIQIQVLSKPDDMGRVEYMTGYRDEDPPWCSYCGGRVSINNNSRPRIRCTGYPSGSTPERKAGCGAVGDWMPRGQVFFAKPGDIHDFTAPNVSLIAFQPA